MRRRLAAANVFLIVMTSAWPLASSRALADPAPGLSLTIESLDGKSTDARESRLAALGVPHGTPPTPFVAPGPFRAIFTGFVNLKLRDQFAFTASGRGDLEVTIDSQVILKCSGEDWSNQHSDLTKLKKGPNEIVVKYTAPKDGDAMVRLLWAEKGKLPDPIAPVVFTHDIDSALAEKLELHQGRELFATLRCLKCHAPANNFGGVVGSMPELSIDAPALEDVGSRLNAQWMAKWISDPRSMRANATMPRLFGHESAGAETVSAARDIAAYLATRTANVRSSETVDQSDANVVAGTRLFTSLGCIGCHTAPGGADDVTRTSLRFVAGKFKPLALVEFLKAPEAHYAWTRMPNFRLSEDEATKLAAFLLTSAPSDALPAIDLSAADEKRGEALFASAGCLNCHAPAQTSGMRAKPQAEWTSAGLSQGCLADAGGNRGAAPDFGFDDAQRDAIRAFARTDWSSLARESLPEFAERSIHALNCTACHRRDAQDDAWSKLAPEITDLEQNLPPQVAPSADQQRPVLTWVGEKLHPDWMANFIAGKIDYKPRPWLVARMPGFASRGALIAQGLCLEHGMSLAESPEPAIDANLAAIGRGLVGRVNGFSCNQCHAVNQSPALVPFDSPAPNLMYVNERLRKEFFHEWVRNPQNYQPGTRMPTYADLDGKTAYKNILDGDAHQQFEAIWQYLRTGRKISPPE